MNDNIIPSKNSNFGIIFIILILLLIVIGAGGSIYYLYILGYFGSHNTVEDIEYVEFFIRPHDAQSNNLISLDFILFEAQKIYECLSRDEFNEYNKNSTLFIEFNRRDLVGKRIDEKGCYVSKLQTVKTDSGRLAEGLNSFTLKKQGIYYFYYFDKNKYYVDKEVWLGIQHAN